MGISLYLDTNVFFHAYCPSEREVSSEWLFSQFEPFEITGITSEWTIVEMFRAFKKQVNLDVIDAEPASIATDYFLAELNKMKQDQSLVLVPVSMNIILKSREQVFGQNLYAADAIHAITAIEAKVDAFITFDGDFRSNLGKIPILNPSHVNFKDTVENLE